VDAPSSDPPVFSSDDFLHSSIENYQQTAPGRMKRKNMYHGTWWGEKMNPKRKRTEFKTKRHLDSGVWMSSDADVDDDMVIETGSNARKAVAAKIVAPTSKKASPISKENLSNSISHPPLPTSTTSKNRFLAHGDMI
jgi:hypothetical protein